MGVSVRVYVSVSGYTKTNEESIIDALKTVYPITEASALKSGNLVNASGENSISYGYAESELGEEIGRAVYNANKRKKCVIEASVTWLDQAPTDVVEIPEKFAKVDE